VSQYCYEHGLVTITAGSYSNVIRLLMPLVITDAQMDEAMDVLEAALAYVGRKERRAGGTASRMYSLLDALLAQFERFN
jgi:hypothetical protein